MWPPCDLKMRKTLFFYPIFWFLAHMTPLKTKIFRFFFPKPFYMLKEACVQWHSHKLNLEPFQITLFHFLPTLSDLGSEKGVTYYNPDRILRFSDWCPFQFQHIVILMIFGDVWGGLGARGTPEGAPTAPPVIWCPKQEISSSKV